MAGELIGFYFKQVIGELLTASALFPDITQRIASMENDQWYSWNEYVEIVNRVAKRYAPIIVSNAGKNIVTQAKDLFVEQGFDNPDSILKDWLALFKANVRGLDAERIAPNTTFFEPGHVIIEAGDAQPMPLVEGYLRGVVEMFGNRVTRLTSRKIVENGETRFRFEMKWE